MFSVGKTSNHAVVMALLYTKGECHGIHAFVIQLRDIDSHQTLPGKQLWLRNLFYFIDVLQFYSFYSFYLTN